MKAPIRIYRYKRVSGDRSFFRKDNSRHEQNFFAEAGQTAANSFFQPSAAIQRKCDKCKEEEKKVQRTADQKEDDEKKLHRKCEQCEEEDKKVQRKEGQPTISVRQQTASYIGSLSTGGNSLAKTDQLFFGRRLGHDLSHVKIHTDTAGAQSAKAINARAYTLNNHIVFNNGAYDTSTTEGKKLLAHELAHVVQQQRGNLKVQRAPDPKEEVKKAYNMSVEKGDKDWAPAEIGLVKSALGRLAAEEKLAIKDYKFVRWTSKEVRIKKDSSYTDPGTSECALHEMDIAKGIYRIAVYDECFGDPEATSDTAFGIDKGEFSLLHEIGHAMEVSEYKNAYLKYAAANKAYNDAITKYKDVEVTPAITTEVNNLAKAEKAAEKEMEAAKGRALKDFTALIAGKDNITEYAGTAPQEAFAEVFAAYKANPEFVKKNYAEVYKWLVAKGHLKKVPVAKKKK